jgi:NTP pyrophosphatase (non-canonical NTP hydrolase)
MQEKIQKELERAIKKFPTWPTDPLHAVAVVGEEYGELVKSILELTYEPEKTTFEEMEKEAIQLAAMSLRFLLSMNDYKFKHSEQHSQVLP